MKRRKGSKGTKKHSSKDIYGYGLERRRATLSSTVPILPVVVASYPGYPDVLSMQLVCNLQLSATERRYVVTDMRLMTSRRCDI